MKNYNDSTGAEERKGEKRAETMKNTKEKGNIITCNLWN
jgi:hypothetical protein